MRLAAAHLPVLCVLFALHGARATSENPPTQRSLYCDGQGPAERVGFDMACPAYAIPETLNNETNPATNCSSLFDAYPVAPDGPYWLRHPVTGAVERKWCLFGDDLGPRTDAGRTEITFITPKGYGAGLTPMSFGSVVDFWSSGRMLRYPDDDWRAWRDTGYVATDAIPLPSWSEGALGTLSVSHNVAEIEFTADAPVVVRMYNTPPYDTDWANAHPELSLWRERPDLAWCFAWMCTDQPQDVAEYRAYERYFPAGTYALNTKWAAYQFFTPAVGVSKESDQPAELESAVAAHPPPTTYATPTVTVAAPGYGAGLTEYDFGSSVDLWATGRMLRYRDDGWRAWRDTGYVATDADPLPSWSENALGTLSVNVGMIEFTTDAPVIVRMYNTVRNDWVNNDWDWLNAIHDLELWRERFDLNWCNAWLCAPINDENNLKSFKRWYEVFERYFPAGTHALDTDDAAYQFFKPADGTLPGTEQPAELESAAYIVETAATTAYATPTVTVAARGYGAGLTEYDFGSSVDLWATGRMLRYPDDDWRAWRDTGYVATDADPLPSWSENALGTLSVNVGMIEFTTDAPVIVRMYNTVKISNWDWLNALDDLELWRERFDLVWCNAWRCAPNNDENSLHLPFYEVFERYFPAGTHALDTDDAAYQFFKPADGTLPGTEQPAELESAAYIVETAATTAYDTPNVTVAASTPNAYTLDSWRVNVNMSSPDSLYVATDADSLPSWSENALGTLSVNVGMIEFTTDAPVIVRMYNTVMNDLNWLNAIHDLELWRERFDLNWCNAWLCAPNNDEHNLKSVVRSYEVFERYFPAGTHALDTDNAAYQFFKPANGTLPGTEQPAELKSALF